ncbi:MAG: glycosyltransferase family 2 protein [Phycisphaerales bacterium]|nr:glycosyltransferase family 2 protein [Phycisphaerales bacterium]
MQQTETHPDYAEVAAILPALNEAESLRRLLPELATFRLGQIIVGDNGSTDETAQVVREHGGLVAHEPRRGYGAACWAAMQHLRSDIRVVLFLDADSSDDLTRLPDLVRPILRDEADLVIATRDAPTVEKGALTFQQRFGNRLAVWLMRMRWGYRYRDLGPFRAIRRESLDRIQMRDRAFGWTVEMQIRALQEKLRIDQVSVHYKRRIGKSKIGGTIRGSIKAGYWILSTIARHWRAT